jgi:flagellar basal body P-ring formation protein FlgA
MSRFESQASRTAGSSQCRALNRVVAACVFAFGAAGAAVPACAQDAAGPIMISGPAETNPAAVLAMAKSAGMTADSTRSSSTPLDAMNARQPSGYRAAAHAADAAMRAAAIALDAHADAADADSGASTNGMIVIPGPGEAKAPAAPVRLAMTVPVSSPPLSLSNSGNPGAADTLPRVVINADSASRDVTPVVVTTEPTAPQPAVRYAARPAAPAAAVKPIAAAAPMPVAGMMPVSMRMPAPVRAAVQPATPAGLSQDGDAIHAAALAFLTQQAAGLPGKADITVAAAFPRGLAPCTTLEPFMPTGTRLWGRTTVGVRCVGERPWTLYLQARVSLQATYYLTARAIAPGEVLSSADLVAREGDLTSMPQAIVTDPSQAVGAVALSRMASGLPLRTDLLRGAGAISIGQTVHVVTGGNGFSITAEGSAMNNASPGQQIKVKTAGGQIISGVVKDSSTVDVSL